MLTAEPDFNYIVFPSWATDCYSFHWEDLPRLLSSPLESGYLDENDWNSVRSGIMPDRVPPFELIDGPFGGGIIAAQRGETNNWLPDCILNKEACYHRPAGFGPWSDRVHGKFSVSVLEMRGDAGLRFFGEGRKKPRQYLCAASIEHADAAKDKLFWFVDYKTRKAELLELDDVPSWAAGWGLSAQRLPEIPAELREETSSWFSASDRSFCWYRIEGDGDGAARQFAMMLYLALHLRWKAGSRIVSMHLVADVEWRPNFRRDLQYK